jgi:predicted dehydrogenase
MKRIKVGIIGCGEVTQINHLPSLNFLGDLFEVTAISDVSKQVLEGVGVKYNIQKRSLDYRELVKDAELDAVLITTPHAYHVEQTLAALEQGKHVLVEKPMAMTLEDADTMIEAQRRTGLIVQVGYMRRYATAFIEAVSRVKNLDGIRLVRVHDVIGWNALMINPTSKVIRGNDVSQHVIDAGNQLIQQKILAAIGEVPKDLNTTYNILLGLSTHDISAMRELLGMPKGVLYAAQRSGGLYITAAFDYGDFVCHFETGIDDVARFDCHLEVYGKSQTLRVEYQSPYVRHQATRLNIINAKPESGLHTETIQPAFEDNFTQEWKAFYQNVTTGNKPKTSPEDYRQDLELFSQMMAKIRETSDVREEVGVS